MKEERNKGEKKTRQAGHDNSAYSRSPTRRFLFRQPYASLSPLQACCTSLSRARALSLYLSPSSGEPRFLSFSLFLFSFLKKLHLIEKTEAPSRGGSNAKN